MNRKGDVCVFYFLLPSVSSRNWSFKSFTPDLNLTRFNCEGSMAMSSRLIFPSPSFSDSQSWELNKYLDFAYSKNSNKTRRRIGKNEGCVITACRLVGCKPRFSPNTKPSQPSSCHVVFWVWAVRQGPPLWQWTYRTCCAQICLIDPTWPVLFRPNRLAYRTRWGTHWHQCQRPICRPCTLWLHMALLFKAKWTFK